MDVLIRDGRVNYDASCRVLQAAKHSSELFAYISVQSLTNVAYYYTKHGVTDPNRFLLPMRAILSYVNLRTISEQNAYNAMAGTFSDFEDELQLQCAIDSDCAYFITGDRKVIDSQPFKLIKAIHPVEFLTLAAKTGA